MKYRKKPIVVEATQWDGGVIRAHTINQWSEGAVRFTGPSPDHLYIVTLEGTMYADPNDWIIKGVKGEFYPCKPDIFEKTYEPVEEQ